MPREFACQIALNGDLTGSKTRPKLETKKGGRSQRSWSYPNLYESTGQVTLMRNLCLSITIVGLTLSSPASAQDGYFADWFHRVDKRKRNNHIGLTLWQLPRPVSRKGPATTNVGK